MLHLSPIKCGWKILYLSCRLNAPKKEGEEGRRGEEGGEERGEEREGNKRTQIEVLLGCLGAKSSEFKEIGLSLDANLS